MARQTFPANASLGGVILDECRITERVRDLDLERNQIVVRNGKCEKDRVTPLSGKLTGALKAHLSKVRALFEKDSENPELAGVYLPAALLRKHKNAGRDWRWQWLWPSREISVL